MRRAKRIPEKMRRIITKTFVLFLHILQLTGGREEERDVGAAKWQKSIEILWELWYTLYKHCVGQIIMDDSRKQGRIRNEIELLRR